MEPQNPGASERKLGFLGEELQAKGHQRRSHIELRFQIANSETATAAVLKVS
jgi:hypothetical protein